MFVQTVHNTQHTIYLGKKMLVIPQLRSVTMIVIVCGVTSSTRLAKQHILSIFRRLLKYLQSKNFKHFKTENIQHRFF